MNWLTNFVRPKLRALVARKEAPENLWLKCPNCEQMLFHRDLEASQQVCSHCDHHLRIKPAARLAALFDDSVMGLRHHRFPSVGASRTPLGGEIESLASLSRLTWSTSVAI